MRKTLFLIIALTLILPILAHSQPEVGDVSGLFIHGENVNLSGSNFGNKIPAAPLIYDNFEGGSPGEVISGGWYIGSTQSTQKPKYSDAVTRMPGLQSAFQDFSNGNYNCTIGLTNLEVGKLYMSGWFYNTTSGNASRNFKWLAFRGGNPGQWTFPNGRMDLYPSVGNGHQYIDNCLGNDKQQDSYAVGGDLHSGAWHRLDTWMDQGSPSGGDGLWQIFLDGTPWSEVSGTFITDNCPYTNFYISSYFALGDVGEPRPEMDMYWDELYVDTTQARIEIGENINFDLCAHREIQIPTQWSPNSVSFTVNRGSFEDGDLVYVFVIDENGVPSQEGAPIIIGTNGGADIPGVPGTPVRINGDG